MDTKTKTAVIVAVIIVVLVGVYAAQALDDKHEDARDTSASVDFLIQDNYGAYFWIEGEGQTVYDAFKDAASTYSVPYVPTKDSSTGEENGISSMYGLEMVQIDGTWYYWNQLYYDGSAWQMNSLYLNGMAAEDYTQIALVYGAYGTTTPADSTPDVLSTSTEGTVFTVESLSGMYFNVAATGTTVFDAWENAMKQYNIPYTATHASYGDGIGSIFGLAMYQDASGNYIYWEQYVVDNGAWTSSMSMMSGIQSADCAKMLLIFHSYGATTPALAPVSA